MVLDKHLPRLKIIGVLFITISFLIACKKKKTEQNCGEESAAVAEFAWAADTGFVNQDIPINIMVRTDHCYPNYSRTETITNAFKVQYIIFTKKASCNDCGAGGNMMAPYNFDNKVIFKATKPGKYELDFGVEYKKAPLKVIKTIIIL